MDITLGGNTMKKIMRKMMSAAKVVVGLSAIAMAAGAIRFALFAPEMLQSIYTAISNAVI